MLKRATFPPPFYQIVCKVNSWGTLTTCLPPQISAKMADILGQSPRGHLTEVPKVMFSIPSPVAMASNLKTINTFYPYAVCSLVSRTLWNREPSNERNEKPPFSFSTVSLHWKYSVLALQLWISKISTVEVEMILLNFLLLFIIAAHLMQHNLGRLANSSKSIKHNKSIQTITANSWHPQLPYILPKKTFQLYPTLMLVRKVRSLWLCSHNCLLRERQAGIWRDREF